MTPTNGLVALQRIKVQHARALKHLEDHDDREGNCPAPNFAASVGFALASLLESDVVKTDMAIRDITQAAQDGAAVERGVKINVLTWVILTGIGLALGAAGVLIGRVFLR